MKKLALVLALCLAGVTGFAAEPGPAPTTNIYGIIDAGVRYDSNTNSKNIDKTAVVTGMTATSRLGFIGSEDLGAGQKAKFRLETSFFPSTGAIGQQSSSGSVLFDRYSWVGFSDPELGEIQLGRNILAPYDFAAAGITDPLTQAMEGAGAPAVVNSNSGALRFNQVINVVAATSSIKSSRSDGLIKYYNTIGDATVIVGFAPGGVAGSSDLKDTFTAGVKYKLGPVTAAASTIRTTDAANKNMAVNSYGATGKVTDDITVTAGYHTVSTDVGYAPANLTTVATSTTVLGGVSGLGEKVSTVGVKYQFTPKISSTLAYYNGNYYNSVTASSGALKTAVLWNQYDFSRRTSVYLELDNARSSGGISQSTLASNSVGGSLGLKHLF